MLFAEHKILGQDDGLVRQMPSGKSMSSGNTKADVVVAVSGLVGVAVGGTDVPAVVDPGTAAQDTAVVLFMTITHILYIQRWIN